MSGRTSVRRVSRLAVASMVLWAAAGASSAWAQSVLKVAPTDALGVFRVKNVGATSKKFGDLANKLGLAAMKPEMADPLGALKTELKITKGVKEDGEFGVVLLPAAAWPAEMGPESKPAAVMLVPVSSYDDFISNFEGAKTEGGVTSFEMHGETSYVMKWGDDFAAIAPTKEFVAMKGEGVKVNASASKEFDSKDLVLWANVPALKVVLAPKLAAHKDEWLSKVESELLAKPESAKYAPTVKVLVGQFLTAADTFLNESQGATYSWNLTDAGINIAAATEFAEGSYLGKLTKSLKGSKQSFTEGMPAGAYLVYGGAAMSGPAMTQLITDFASPVLAEAKKIEGAGPDIQTAFDSALDMFKHVKSSNFALMAPKGAIGQESLFQVASYVKGDAKEYLAAMKAYSEANAKAMASVQTTGVAPFKSEFKPASKTVDGVTFDVLETQLNPNPKTPEEANLNQILGIMYGPNGLSQNTAMLNDSTAIMCMGLPDASISKFIVSAKAGSDELGKLAHVQATTKELPDSPVSVTYIALDEIIRTGTRAAQQFGLPVNLVLPENLPPIGLALDADGTTLRFDSHIPTELVQSIVSAAMMMQGGGGGGGGF